MDGKWLAAGSITGICYVYTIEINGEFSLKQKIAAHEHYILKVLFSPDSKYLATCSSDHSAKLFKYTDTGFETYIILHGHSKWVWDCVFSCDSEYLVTGINIISVF
jgi:G protein beta subunit-like protein